MSKKSDELLLTLWERFAVGDFEKSANGDYALEELREYLYEKKLISDDGRRIG